MYFPLFITNAKRELILSIVFFCQQIINIQHWLYAELNLLNENVGLFISLVQWFRTTANYHASPAKFTIVIVLLIMHKSY